MADRHAAEQLHRALRHRAAHFAALGFAHGAFEVVGLAGVPEPCGVEHGEGGGFGVRFHLDQFLLGRAALMEALVPIDFDAFFLERIAREVERADRFGDAARRNRWARHVKGAHHALVAARALVRLHALIAAEQMIARDAAIAERERRRVGGADAELLLLPHHLKTRRAFFDDEAFDARAPGALVDRRPNYNCVALNAGGHEDLVAVQHPLVAIEPRCGLDRLGVGADVRLGDRHGEQLIAPARLLLLRARCAKRCVAKSKPAPAAKGQAAEAQAAKDAVGRARRHRDEHLQRHHRRIVRLALHEELHQRRKLLRLRKLLRRPLVLVIFVIARVLLRRFAHGDDLLKDRLIGFGDAEIDHVRFS